MTKRKSYSKEFKRDAVNLVLEQGYSSAQPRSRLVHELKKTKKRINTPLWAKVN